MRRDVHTRTLNPLRRTAVVGLGLIALCAAGCSIIGSVTDVFNPPDSDGKGRTSLPPIRRASNVARLELVFVERPADDPLLREDKLLEGVDTVGGFRAAARTRLHDHGFRVGHSSSTPNDALETMLGLASSGAATADGSVRGRRIDRPAGGDTEVQTSPVQAELSVRLGGDDSIPKEFRNARCLFRVKVVEVGRGWATLQFTPEIHHGRMTYRRVATDGGWQGKTSQKIHHLFDHRFQMTLNTGEMAILTADPNQLDSAGARFFVTRDGSTPRQRVLIVRLADAVGGP